MIDHVSIPVRDLNASKEIYRSLLAPLGLVCLVERERSVGFGKSYPEFWLNLRPELEPILANFGAHAALRAPGEEAVRAFFASAIAAGCANAGEPGIRQAEMGAYFGAFIHDPDGNKIEAVHFPRG
jgi:catechol 2,3-dioxygenase-like lactoylglutathione lyase family enzyme